MKCLNPRWNEIFTFDLEDISHSIFQIEVYDYDIVGKDDFIGSFSLTGLQIKKDGSVVDKWVELKDSSDVNGKVI